jgi:aspartate dehydrogenase
MNMKVSVLGCGYIGSAVAERIQKGDAGEVQLVSVFDRHPEKAERLANRLGVKAAHDMDEIVNNSNVDLVVELASQEAVKEYGLRVLEAGKDILVLSSGSLVDAEFAQKMIATAEANSTRIYVPSGSIMAVDGVKAHHLAGISEITLEYRKNPEDFKDRQDAFQRLYKPGQSGAVTLFEGPASEASRLFPRRLNISSTISLAGVGAEKTTVRVIADPDVHTTDLNIHIKSRAGEMTIQANNLSHKDSGVDYMPVVSTLQTLKGIGATLSLGA